MKQSRRNCRKRSLRRSMRQTRRRKGGNASNSSNTSYVLPTGFTRRRRLSNSELKKYANMHNCSKVPEEYIQEKMVKNVLCDKKFTEGSALEIARRKALSGNKNAIKNFFRQYRSIPLMERETI